MMEKYEELHKASSLPKKVQSVYHDIKTNVTKQKLYFYNNHFLFSEAPRWLIPVTLKLKVSKSGKILSFKIHTYIWISEYV